MTKTATDNEQLNGDGAAYTRITRADLEEVKHYKRRQILAMVGLYYDIQKVRVGASNKGSAIDRGMSERPSDGGDRDDCLVHKIRAGLEMHEREAERAMAAYARQSPLGQWALKIHGIGTTFAAALLAFVDFDRCCCESFRGVRQRDIPEDHRKVCPGLSSASALCMHAGMVDPRVIRDRWRPGCIRPYNNRLKTVCFQIGDSFRKLAYSERNLTASPEQIAEDVRKAHALKRKKDPSLPELTDREVLHAVAAKRVKAQQKRDKVLADPNYLYSRLYVQRKQREVQRNEAGEFATRAREMLEEALQKRRKISKEQLATWEAGRLQAAGLDLRARRYAVSMFLSHFYQVGMCIHRGRAVKPWVIAHGGHDGYIPPPNWVIE